MIGLLYGEIEELSLDSILLVCSGVGYGIQVSQNTMEHCKQHSNIRLYTKMIVREDNISLIGFFEKSEKELFEQLTSVSKIGPKVGLSILSTYQVDQIKSYIVTANIEKLSKVSGVGKKTAERIVLELKDKISHFEIDNDAIEIASPINQTEDDAIEALVSLGFSKNESYDAVQKVKQQYTAQSLDELIPLALSKLSKV